MELKETKEFYEEWEDMIEDTLLDNTDKNWDITVKEIFLDESNYNNGDVLSGQYSYDKGDIESRLEEVVEYLKTQPLRCPECGLKYVEDGYVSQAEHRPYGESGCYENVAIGYGCNCGYSEDFK